MASELTAQERLKAGHDDIGRERCNAGGDSLGLWDSEVEDIAKARDVLEEAKHHEG